MKFKYISIQFHKDKPVVENGCIFGDEMNLSSGEEREARDYITNKEALGAIDDLATEAKHIVEKYL